jgi:hypothetical protein
MLLLQAGHVLHKVVSNPQSPTEVKDVIKAVTLPGAASISKSNARAASTTEEPGSDKNYNFARAVFGIKRPQLHQTFHLIAEAHTVVDLWRQAAAAEARGDTQEATRLLHLAADRVERVWRNHAELVERRAAARASTVQRKAAARKKQQPDALDGTKSAIRDTSLKLFARLPLRALHRALEKLKGRPAGAYSPAGTRYHNLGVDGKEAAGRIRCFVLHRLANLRRIMSGRSILTLPPVDSERLVDQLARAYPATAPVIVAAQEEAYALAKELSRDWRNVVAIGMFSMTLVGGYVVLAEVVPLVIFAKQ